MITYRHAKLRRAIRHMISVHRHATNDSRNRAIIYQLEELLNNDKSVRQNHKSTNKGASGPSPAAGDGYAGRNGSAQKGTTV
jgi:hypothetical protein